MKKNSATKIKPKAAKPSPRLTHAQNNQRQSAVRRWLAHNRSAFSSCLATLRQAPCASALTACVLAIAIALPFALYLLLHNFERLAPLQQLSPSVSVYLNTSTNSQDANGLITQIQAWPDIQRATYISPQQGLNELAAQFKLTKLIDNLPQNPLPQAIQLQLTHAAQTPSNINKIIEKLNTLPGVQQVQTDSDWVTRLYYVLRIGQYTTMLFMMLFTTAIILLTIHTLANSLARQQKEILVLELIGAPPLLIRGPLLYRGICLGFVSSLLACGIITLLFYLLQSPITALANSYHSQFALQSLSLNGVSIAVLGCTLLGWLSAWGAFMWHHHRRGRHAF